MKPIVKHTILIAITALLLVLWFVGDRLAADNRREITCKGVVAVIADSADRAFVKAGDIVSFMEDYGTYVGLRLDSVDLRRVEAVIDGKSAVKKSQAWLTDDGYIHISVTQREPLVRFQHGETGFYVDRSGYLFPLQSGFTSRVPIVDGEIPLRQYRGEPETEAEKAWIGAMTELVGYMSAQKVWSDNISQITVLKGGDLLLVPREGRERFLFGPPTDIAAKFDRIRKYYESIAPNCDPGTYSTVNVKYDGQIICRKK